MLWNNVFEFFVRYIFGGLLDTGGGNYQYFNGALGGYLADDFSEDTLTTANLFIKGFGNVYGNAYYMPLGNYLSLIATIISMVAIVLICCALIKKIYNMCAHIIG